jgi:hypothetical protein
MAYSLSWKLVYWLKSWKRSKQIDALHKEYCSDICTTESKEHRSSWGANSHSDRPTQKLTHILSKPKAYYPIHKISPLVPILKINQVQILLPYSLWPVFNIILLSIPKTSKCSLPFRSLEQNCVCVCLSYISIIMNYARLGSDACLHAL